jgi:hypothetical protein
MTPAMNGPAKMPAPSTTPDVAFAAVRCSTDVVTLGRRAFCAGRVIVTATAAEVAAVYTIQTGASAKRAPAVAPMATACRTYPTTSTRSRRKRSPANAATGAMTAEGMSMIVATRPAATAPPREYA